jgi:fructose-1,6-bisphosphatase/inositol monophosphatase family enzyme
MNHELVIEMLIEAGKAVRSKVIASLKASSVEQLSAVYAEKSEDTIYTIDREVEEVLMPVLESYAQAVGGIVLLAEGIGEDEEGTVLPVGTERKDAAIKVIIDPIDGTRCIMYNKRAAFFLAAAAPNKSNASLVDIETAVMMELPTTKQFEADVLWAIKGKGCFAQSENILNGEVTPKQIRPSRAKTIIGGFAQLARFFPPGREILSKIEDELIQTLIPSNPGGKALVFEDQYISSGGQLYEILMGHDRFVADVRGMLYKYMSTLGKEGGHVCHPYDICAHLIGLEAGVIITDGVGNPLNVPLDLTSDVNWVAYANADIEKEVKPLLQSLLKKYKLITE